MPGRARAICRCSVTWDPYSILTLHEPFRATSLSGALWPYYGSDWIFYNGWVNHAGHPIYDGDVYKVCSAPPNWDDGGALPRTTFTACTHAHGWLYMITYQPADRFWLYQGIESAIFFSLATALGFSGRVGTGFGFAVGCFTSQAILFLFFKRHYASVFGILRSVARRSCLSLC